MGKLIRSSSKCRSDDDQFVNNQRDVNGYLGNKAKPEDPQKRSGLLGLSPTARTFSRICFNCLQVGLKVDLSCAEENSVDRKKRDPL